MSQKSILTADPFWKGHSLFT